MHSIAQLLHTTWPVGRVKPGYAVQSIMGATLNRRDNAGLEFTGLEWVFCIILLYVFSACFGVFSGVF